MIYMIYKNILYIDSCKKPDKYNNYKEFFEKKPDNQTEYKIQK